MRKPKTYRFRIAYRDQSIALPFPWRFVTYDSRARDLSGAHSAAMRHAEKTARKAFGRDASIECVMCWRRAHPGANWPDPWRNPGAAFAPSEAWKGFDS